MVYISFAFRKGTQGMTWSEATVKKALQLKFACGRTGYELLIEQGMSLPCIKTLQRRVKAVDFEPGIFNLVFDLLKTKVITFCLFYWFFCPLSKI